MEKQSCYCTSSYQRTYLALVYLNMTRTQLIQCHSIFLTSLVATYYRAIWNMAELQLFENLATELAKGKYFHINHELSTKYPKTIS